MKSNFTSKCQNHFRSKCSSRKKVAHHIQAFYHERKFFDGDFDMIWIGSLKLECCQQHWEEIQDFREQDFGRIFSAERIKHQVKLLERRKAYKRKQR